MQIGFCFWGVAQHRLAVSDIHRIFLNVGNFIVCNHNADDFIILYLVNVYTVPPRLSLLNALHLFNLETLLCDTNTES